MKIALYIPCFNAQKTISACLDAVFAQSKSADTVLVIDDGSTDMTVEIAKKYPLKIIKHAKNRGLAAARNSAIKNTDAEFIASLDSDCKPNKDWLDCLIKGINSPKVAGSGGKIVESSTSSVFDLWRSVHMPQHWGAVKKINPAFLFGSNTLFRRDSLIQAGFYNESFKNNAEDVDISNRLRQRGYNLVYEPRAVARHLREDDLGSLLDNFWKWNFAFYIEKEFYENPERFASKIKDNMGLANRFLGEDLKNKRYALIYLDFLIALHHSLRDFEYYNFQGKPDEFNIAMRSKVSLWLSLLDLTFSYHFDYSKSKLSCLITKEHIFQQNFFALGLILSGFVKTKFRSMEFRKILYKHLLFSVYKIRDDQLLDRLFNLVELHQDWSGLVQKGQVNLDQEFLGVAFLNFKNWIENLVGCFPDIAKLIENSAKKTEKAIIKACTPR
jgi:glycosyltransferase involved in cell wall biosynthesis